MLKIPPSPLEGFSVYQDHCLWGLILGDNSPDAAMKVFFFFLHVIQENLNKAE